MTAQTAKESNAMNAGVPQARHRKGALAAIVATAALALSACNGTGDLASYDLPAKSARYTFESETNGVKTQWEYVSGQPTQGDAPQQNPCMGDTVGDNTAACRPEPLIFLRYDLGLALDNTAKAEEKHTITITAYYQDRISAPPKVDVLTAEASYDGGHTWKQVSTQASGTNTFTAQIKNPDVAQAAQGVGLRVHASDTKGDTVSQTLPTAYKLR
ncbi:hypothetical protein [Streptomyces brasiliensis]|uniref:Uncharacterized protein n=1 Tax=Streptomyces brasiliensis TaxID=1954 RepID=A0A917PC07_9ACTN|nr:hypothetical protein [Streptomyces brasiliensis]GGJ70183.1 hypothetical protein GCM10010121_096030 [Streptomyces brasiliensis]